MECKPDDCGGAECANDAECENELENPLMCDSTCQKCVPGGDTGILCDSDADCQYECNEDLQCVFGGGGGICDPYSNKCKQQESTCNELYQCVPDDCGEFPCSADEECYDQPLMCDSKCLRCVPGGDTGVECSFDEECRDLPFGCDEESQCVVGGERGPCDPEDSESCQGEVSADNFNIDYEYCDKVIYFSWQYHSKKNVMEGEFQFRLVNADTGDVVADDWTTFSPTCSGRGCFDGDVNQQAVSMANYESLNHMAYGETYLWQVRVYNVLGNDSGWIDAGEFNTDAHRPPSPVFSVYPTPSNPSAEVNFSNSSECFSSFGEKPCARYSWDFGDKIGTSSDENPSYLYKSKGNYFVVLEACDEKACCLAGLNHAVKDNPNSQPNWKEISPFK